MAEPQPRPTVYVETTIPSYLTSWPRLDVVLAAHQQVTRIWWADAGERFDLFISSVVVDEASQGDAEAARQRLEAIGTLPMLEETPDIPEIAAEYVRVLNLPAKAARDALHLAYAVSYELEYLVTWNLRHLANAATMKRVTQFNLSKGWHIPLIVTPEHFLPLNEEQP